VLYFGAFDSNAYAITAAEGKLVWKTRLEGWVWTDPTFNAGTLYLGDVRGRAYALDAATGQLKWYYDTRDSIKGQPILFNDKLYIVSMDTNVYALDPAGSQRDAKGKVDYNQAIWRNETLVRRLVSTPAIWNDADLVVPLLDGDIKMWTLDASTGTRKMQFPPAPSGTPAPGR